MIPFFINRQNKEKNKKEFNDFAPLSRLKNVETIHLGSDNI